LWVSSCESETEREARFPAWGGEESAVVGVGVFFLDLPPKTKWHPTATAATTRSPRSPCEPRSATRGRPPRATTPSGAWTTATATTPALPGHQPEEEARRRTTLTEEDNSHQQRFQVARTCWTHPVASPPRARAGGEGMTDTAVVTKTRTRSARAAAAGARAGWTSATPRATPSTTLCTTCARAGLYTLRIQSVTLSLKAATSSFKPAARVIQPLPPPPTPTAPQPTPALPPEPILVKKLVSKVAFQMQLVPPYTEAGGSGT
jgi:hypothetical protein